MLTEAAARLQQAGFPHAVPVTPDIAPRSVFRWLHRHLPGAAASLIPYEAEDIADEFGVGFLVGFEDRRQAEAFASGMAAGLTA